MRVQRLDRGTLPGAASSLVRTPQGGLRAPAAFTRVGVFEYSDAEGNTWTEWKPAEEAFAPAMLASLAGTTVTDDHPAGLVTTDTWRALAIGHVGDDVHQDGAFVAGSVVVQHRDAVRLVESGALVEISLGYTCEVEPTAGVTPDGEAFDCIQRNILVNHAALIGEGEGRAGPDCALRLNAADAEAPARVHRFHAAAVQVKSPLGVIPAPPVAASATATPTPTADARQEIPSMKTMKIGGREFKLDADAEVMAAQGAVDEMAKKADADVSALEGLLAKMTEEVAKLKGAPPPAVTDEMVPEEVMNAALVKRASLHADARAVLGADAKLDGKGGLEVKRLVLAHALPDVKLDGLAPATLEGMYVATVAGARKAAATVAQVPARNDALASANAAAVGLPGTSDNDDPAAALAKRREAQRESAMKGAR